MSKVLIVFLLSLVCSCGAGPLFSSLKDEERIEQGVVVNLEDNKIRQWGGDSRLNYALSWKEAPSFGAKSSLIIKFWDSYQNDFFGPYEKLSNNICAFLWMKMPDGNEHGSSPITMVEEVDSYFFDDIYFIMAGHWELRIRTVESASHCTSLKNSPYIHEEILKIYVK